MDTMNYAVHGACLTVVLYSMEKLWDLTVYVLSNCSCVYCLCRLIQTA